jgi:hypothetical protein
MSFDNTNSEMNLTETIAPAENITHDKPSEQAPKVKSVIDTNLEAARTNMLDNMNKLLLDDCYVYIMTIPYDDYIKHTKSGDNSFYVGSMILTADVAKRINDIYLGLGRKNVNKIVSDDYHNIVKSSVNRINAENHGFTLAFNKKSDYCNYDLVFVTRD